MRNSNNIDNKIINNSRCRCNRYIILAILFFFLWLTIAFTIGISKFLDVLKFFKPANGQIDLTYNDFISSDNQSFQYTKQNSTRIFVLQSISQSTKRFDNAYNSNSELVAVYRLIGNDMPPLQSSGQLLRNTLYALRHEPPLEGAVKKWVLNRIWNDTMFHLLYDNLISHGVSKSDILVRCFQVEEYSRMPSFQDRLLYLTSQNEARNEAIRDAKSAGFAWSLVLDGNTFVTSDAWLSIRAALGRAAKLRMAYMKVPYHRLHEPQSPQWLHEATSMAEVLRRAPTKGESQVAFHRSAPEAFSLGNTRPDGKRGRKKGYGQRNKAYLFKDGQRCARDSQACMCADVEEGNEEDLAARPAATNASSYVARCGLVLRLWSFPTDAVVDTGLPADEEEGFYCYLDRVREVISAKSECSLLQKALTKWALMRRDKKNSLRLGAGRAQSCKTRYSRSVLTQSCLRAAARDRAVRLADQSIQLLRSFHEDREREGKGGRWANTTCNRILLGPPPSQAAAGPISLPLSPPPAPPLLMFRAAVLHDSKVAWMKFRDRQRSGPGPGSGQGDASEALVGDGDGDGEWEGTERAMSLAVESLLATAADIGRAVAAGQQRRDPMGDVIATALALYFTGSAGHAHSAAALLGQLWGGCDLQCLVESPERSRSNRTLLFYDALAILAASQSSGPQRSDSGSDSGNLFADLRLPALVTVPATATATAPGQDHGPGRGSEEKSWVFPHMKFLAAAVLLGPDRRGDGAALLQRLVLQLVRPYPAGYFQENGSVPGLDYGQGQALLAAAEAVSCWLDTAQLVEAAMRAADPCSAASWWSLTHIPADSDPTQALSQALVPVPVPVSCDAEVGGEHRTPVLRKAIQRILAALATQSQSRSDAAARSVFSRLAHTAERIYNCSLPAGLPSTETVTETWTSTAAEPWSYFALGSISPPRSCWASDPATRDAFALAHIAAELQTRDAKQRKQSLVLLRAPKKISSSLFHYAIERPDVALYRVLGNDLLLAPLQSPDRVLGNVRHIVRNEGFFEGVEKKWILHRIWNQTVLRSALRTLVEGGVSLADILVECFDAAAWAALRSPEERERYLFARHAPRDAALEDGLRRSGREWVLVLDANAFVPTESWLDTRQALSAAQTHGLQWMKVPQHGSPEQEQDQEHASWLHSGTDTLRLLTTAVVKAPSDVAFHRRVVEDNRTESSSSSSSSSPPSPGEGLYLAGERACYSNSGRQCKCAEYSEEYQLSPMPESRDFAYAKACGLTVRLSSRGPAQWREAQLSRRLGPGSDGFFCFLERMRGKLRPAFPSECAYFSAGAAKWETLNQTVRHHFSLLSVQGSTGPPSPSSAAAACRSSYLRLAAAAPCFESQLKAALVSEQVGQEGAHLAQLSPPWEQSVCPAGGPRSLGQGDTAENASSYLVAFDEPSLEEERQAWLATSGSRSGSGSGRSDLAALVSDLLKKAGHGLSQGPFSVTKKLQSAPDGKRYYFSFRPYLWPYSLLPRSLQKKVNAGVLKLDPPCCLHRDGHRVPGTVIGGYGENHFDRASAWYLVDNVTTLALAWHFTRDARYARHGAYLVDTYFLNESTSMLPSLQYAQNGYKYGLIDWKDLYYLLDAVTLLHRSGALSDRQRAAMQRWCSRLGHWILQSDMGHDEARALNNHGLYLDVTALSLFVFSREAFFVRTARRRLLFRLASEHPIGHFDADGGQPHESGRPTGLHYITFNLVGWVHAALICEAVRMRSAVPAAELSLWLVKHHGEAHDPAAQPVLCKAIRYLSTYLPARAAQYEQYTQPEDGMGVSWPHEQADAFAFDRMLEIVRYGVRVYGLEALFPGGHVPQNVRVALDYPLYSTRAATHTKFSSVHPDSGNRAWPSLGLIRISKPISYFY